MKKIRTLLVDDSEDYRKLIRTALERDRRFEVVGEAVDGADGVFQAIESQPDVILLDLSMPVMDGLQALDGLRSAAPDSRILVCSAFDETFGPDTVEMGAQDHIQKGTSLGEILEKIVAVAGLPIEKKMIEADSDWLSRYLIAVLTHEAESPGERDEHPSH